MTNSHGITGVALVLLAAVMLAHGAILVSATHRRSMEVGEVATPNHDPHHGGVVRTVATTVPAEVAAADPLPVEVPDPATPNHEPRRVGVMPTVAAPMPTEIAAWTPVLLRVEPEAAAPPAPRFAAADTMLYARANARLRAGPSIAADVVAKLAADAPLRAIARSTDGTWWKVSLADQRTGYVRKDVVTKVRPVAKTLPATTTPVATAFPQPAPAPRRDGALGFVDEAMNWLTDMAYRGHSPAPKAIRTER
jgi:hypothetical protein